ncbi:MAG: hypothetical protein GX593_04850 [Actinomycetales bacterium]|nr:hypothetical protein [Actinomycetales bacterium]
METTTAPTSVEVPKSRSLLLAVASFVLFAGLGLAGLALRPIQATALILLGVIALGVLTYRSRAGSNSRAWWTGAVVGLLAVVLFYYTSALINLEPSRVSGGG